MPPHGAEDATQLKQGPDETVTNRQHTKTARNGRERSCMRTMASGRIEPGPATRPNAPGGHAAIANRGRLRRQPPPRATGCAGGILSARSMRRYCMKSRRFGPSNRSSNLHRVLWPHHPAGMARPIQHSNRRRGPRLRHAMAVDLHQPPPEDGLWQTPTRDEPEKGRRDTTPARRQNRQNGFGTAQIPVTGPAGKPVKGGGTPKCASGPGRAQGDAADTRTHAKPRVLQVRPTRDGRHTAATLPLTHKGPACARPLRCLQRQSQCSGAISAR